MAEDDDWRWEGFTYSRHSFFLSFLFRCFCVFHFPRRVRMFHRLEDNVRDDELCDSGCAACVSLCDASCAELSRVELGVLLQTRRFDHAV